ncbi:MAG: DNA polymerase III subunit delta [Acetatifactor sp.]|nr:DNA polymerase III subunit delta [Acetatifactor sp.]
MKRIDEDIKQNTFARAYLLYGEERYLVLQYRDKLEKAMCDPDDTMNNNHFAGKDMDVNEVIDLAETLPFLAERRVIFISDSGMFKSGGDRLADYLKECNDTTYFVFTEIDVDKRSRLYKAVANCGHVAECKTPDDRTLKIWIATGLKRENLKISEQTCEYFMEKVGTDMANMKSELDKLISYAAGKDTVTAEDIDAICTTTITNNVFDLTNALGDGNIKKALDIYYDMIALKEPPLRILFHIGRQYNQMLIAKTMKNSGHGNGDIASALGVPPFVAGKYINRAANYSVKRLKALIKSCVEADQSVKTGQMDETIAVELVITAASRKEI